MASSKKRPHLLLETPDTTESSSAEEDNNMQEGNVEDEDEDDDISDEDDDDLDDLDPANREIQVEFEARTPEACDYHGILRLLKKHFGEVTAVNLSDLADFIIAQRNVGSVVTQSRNEDEEEDEDEDDDQFEDLNNEVFGLMTIVRLGKDRPLAKAIMEHVMSVTKKSGDCITKIANLLDRADATIGFIISERIVNIPPQISVPLYESLFSEIAKAKAKNCPFNFTHYLMLSRMLYPANSSSGGGGSMTSSSEAGPSVLHVNAEEEVITEEADAIVETEIPAEKVTKTFDINAKAEFEERTKIIVFNAAKVDSVILPKIKAAFPL